MNKFEKSLCAFIITDVLVGMIMIVSEAPFTFRYASILPASTIFVATMTYIFSNE